ncbi:hypothetical protein TL16_g07002 [Triparma laevis f. inornata]|uniref:Uncharacterized protein n=1 Tax=Triparma laevis f. inornata TaxID=1714386 RepID=A0A9W7APX9_9STRA|nr:hypothetical protein TL16_g07002 [Triparma laevis f. inornata]
MCSSMDAPFPIPAEFPSAFDVSTPKKAVSKKPFLKRGSRKEPSSLHRIKKKPSSSPTQITPPPLKPKLELKLQPCAPIITPEKETPELSSTSTLTPLPSSPPHNPESSSEPLQPSRKLVVSPQQPQQPQQPETIDDFEALENMLGLTSSQTSFEPPLSKPIVVSIKNFSKPPPLKMKLGAPKLPCEVVEMEKEEEIDFGIDDYEESYDNDYNSQTSSHVRTSLNSFNYAAEPPPVPQAREDRSYGEEIVRKSSLVTSVFRPNPSPNPLYTNSSLPGNSAPLLDSQPTVTKSSQKINTSALNLLKKRESAVSEREEKLQIELKHLTRLREQMTSSMSRFEIEKGRMKSEVEEVKGECRKWCEGEREKVKKEKGKWAGEMGKLRRLREGGELAEAGAGQDGKKYRSEIQALKATIVSLKNNHLEEVKRIKGEKGRIQTTLERERVEFRERGEEVKRLKEEMEVRVEEGGRKFEKERRVLRSRIAKLEKVVREKKAEYPEEEDVDFLEARRKVEEEESRRRERIARERFAEEEYKRQQMQMASVEEEEEEEEEEETVQEVKPAIVSDAETEEWLRSQMAEFERSTAEAIRESVDSSLMGFGKKEERAAAPVYSPDRYKENAPVVQNVPPVVQPTTTKQTQIDSSGAKTTTYPNGTVKKFDPATSTETITFNNGDVKTVKPDQTIIYYYATAKTYHTTLPTGDSIYEFIESNQVEIHRVGGEKEIRYGDGTVKYVKGGGEWEGVFGDGVRVYVVEIDIV